MQVSYLFLSISAIRMFAHEFCLAFHQKSPIFYQKSSAFFQKSPVFYQKSPAFHFSDTHASAHSSLITHDVCNTSTQQTQLQPIAFGVSFILNLQSQSHRSLSSGTWQKRRRELDNRLSFEIRKITLQVQ